jgi:hypothetical protein
LEATSPYSVQIVRGADLDIEASERVEADLNRLIERRDAERRESEGERLEERIEEPLEADRQGTA